MKLLLDMNMLPQWQRLLQDAGFEAVHWSLIGAAADPDTHILDFAARSGYTIITLDLDFGNLLARRKLDRPSVVQIRSKDLFPYVIGERVLAALREAQEQLEAGAFISIDSQRTRLRKLPFVL